MRRDRPKRTSSRRSRPTHEEIEKRKIRVKQQRLNLKKLTDFLSNEERKEVPELSTLAKALFPNSTIPPGYMTVHNLRYADPIIEAFHAHASVSKATYTPDFNPKTEYDKFIRSYVGRFGEPAPQPKPKISRQGVGGAPKQELTIAVQAVLEEAQASAELSLNIVVDKVWEKLYPTKDKTKYTSKLNELRRNVRERLNRPDTREWLKQHAPQLMSKPRSKNHNS